MKLLLAILLSVILLVKETGAFCGDGVIDAGEKCDDDFKDDNGCTNDCTDFANNWVCWNENDKPTRCTRTCAKIAESLVAVDLDDLCDDGNLVDGDGCSK